MNDLRKKMLELVDSGEAYPEETVDRVINAVIAEMHDSIMRHELSWPNTREDAWLNATIHRWIDSTLQSAKEPKS